MKLAAVYNVWSDSSDLLKGSIERIHEHVDMIVIVYQTTSNFGVFDNSCLVDIEEVKSDKTILLYFEPVPTWGGTTNELNKRKQGVSIAKQQGCTHFILMDCDEYYESWEFKRAKDWVKEMNFKATYCDLWTYYLKPDIRLKDKEKYFVPFICSMDSLPIGGKFGKIYVDPTRKATASNPIQAPITMHHLSWIRKDIWAKVNNSSAKNNLIKAKELIQHDLLNAENDMFSKFYNCPLVSC